MPLLLYTSSDAIRARHGSQTIEIALLNNLSDGALESGERQFTEALAEAAGPDPVRLRMFSLPSIPRGPAAQARIAARYTPFADLMQSRVDGLIVTGAEPREERLPQEHFWRQLTEVIDWAEHNTRSTIWSCLAAHAAALHLDGIDRQRLPRKCSGLFEVERVAEHPLIAGLRQPPTVPHSRWNEIESNKLLAAGYQILTTGKRVGADIFIKEWRSLFVYLQGHPEYDAGALGREFDRDIGRYLRGAFRECPRPPENYFEPATYYGLEQLMSMTCGKGRLELQRGLPVRRDMADKVRLFSRTLYRNWLSHLSAAVNSLPDPSRGRDLPSSGEEANL